MAYIYKITNDINQKVYIGKTEFSIEKRFKEHCQDAFRERNEQRPLYAAMRKYGIEHFYIELIEETVEPEERERYWIKQYSSYHNDYNATIGGEGKHYINHDQILDLYDSGNFTQQEIALKCQCSTDTVRNVVYQNRQNIHWPLAEAQIAHLKPVLCVELNKTFPSIISAAKWLEQNGYINSYLTIKPHISAVCKGKRKTCCNFHWKYV